MKNPFRRPYGASPFVLSLIFSTSPLFATDSTWTGSALDSLWTSSANWAPAGVAGSTVVVAGADTGNPDAATFNHNLNKVITVDEYRNLRALVFAPGVEDFTLESGNIVLSDAASVVVQGGVTWPQTIASPVAFVPAAVSGVFTSNTTNPDSGLYFTGTITGQRPASNITSLILNGVGEGTISGVLGNGNAGGKLSIAKGGSGTWTFTGANTFTGGITANNGRLVLDYTTEPAVSASNVLNMGGGALVIKGRSTGTTAQTLGDMTLTSGKGASTLVVDNNGGAGTTLTLGNSWTRSSGGSLLLDLSSGGSIVSSPTLTNSVVTGAAAGTAAGFLVKDSTGKVDYASRNTGTGKIVRLDTIANAVVTYATGSAVAATDKNYRITGDTTLTSGTNTFGTLRIDASANPVTLTVGSTDLLFGKSVMIVDGANDVMIASSTGGKIAIGGLIVANYGTGTTTLALRVGGGTGTTALSYMGTGVTALDFDNSGQGGASTIQGGILRLANTKALPTGNLAIQNGGILELGAGDFTRGIGTGIGGLQFNSGSGGFSAFGAPRAVNLGGSAGSLTWGAAGSLFLADGSILILGSRTSDNTVTFANALNLNDGNRVVQVNDGVSAAGLDAIMSGALTSTNATAGMLTKTGAGTLALTGTNTYGGGTNVLAGQLNIGDGLTGTLANTGVLYNNSVVAFNRSNTYGYGGSITGTGQVKQIGAGKLTLSGSNTYTGQTTVSNGSFAGVGCAASDLVVQSALLEPGITVGTLFAASATLDPQSTMVVQVDGVASDRLKATGAIQLAGKLTISPIGSGVTYSDYVIAEGAGLTGTFSEVTAGFKVTYTATQAILNTAPTYRDWAALWAPGESEAFDHDGDGVANGVEYFMGATGSTRTILPGFVELDGSRTITWPKGISYYGLYGSDHVVQISTSMAPEGQQGGWVDVPAAQVTDTASSLAYTMPSDWQRCFVRLKVIVREVPDIIPVPPTKIPPMPLGLAMTANSASSITMTWYSSPVNDDVAASYNIYAGNTIDGTFVKIGTSTARSFTESGLAANTGRYYKVTAVNVVGESAKQANGIQGFSIVPSDGSVLPVLIAKNMCLTTGATIVSTVAPSLGTLSKLNDGLDSTSCGITGAHEVRMKLNTTLPFSDAAYLLLNFRTDQTGQAYPYNINYRSLKSYVITQSMDSTNGVDGTWSDVVAGSNTYLDGVVVIPNNNPKWIGVRNSGGIQLARMEIFRGAPAGSRNDYWIFAGDSLVVQDMVGGGAASAHSVWFSDLVRQRHPDRYPIVVNSSQGGEIMSNTRGRLANQLPIACAPNGTPTPTGTFLCFEPGFNDVGVGGGLWMGTQIINELKATQTLCDTHGMFLVPVRIEYSTHHLNLDTLEPSSYPTFFNTLAVNLAGVDVYTREFAPYACDPVTQLPYADYWSYTRNNYATALASDGVHHTKAGMDGINTLWADVAGKMIYLREP